MLVMIEPKVLYDILSNDIYIDKGKTTYFNLNANGCWMATAVKLDFFIPGLQNVNDFDAYVVDMILSNEKNFINFIPIPYTLQQGYDVFAMVYNGFPILKSINEIIFKIIQKRYGYNYQIVNCKEDLNTEDNSSFTTPGILTLDQDIQRYQAILGWV